MLRIRVRKERSFFGYFKVGRGGFREDTSGHLSVFLSTKLLSDVDYLTLYDI